jgi:hypothetical protein
MHISFLQFPDTFLIIPLVPPTDCDNEDVGAADSSECVPPRERLAALSTERKYGLFERKYGLF